MLVPVNYPPTHVPTYLRSTLVSMMLIIHLTRRVDTIIGLGESVGALVTDTTELSQAQSISTPISTSQIKPGFAHGRYGVDEVRRSPKGSYGDHPRSQLLSRREPQPVCCFLGGHVLTWLMTLFAQVDFRRRSRQSSIRSDLPPNYDSRQRAFGLEQGSRARDHAEAETLWSPSMQGEVTHLNLKVVLECSSFGVYSRVKMRAISQDSLSHPETPNTSAPLQIHPSAPSQTHPVKMAFSHLSPPSIRYTTLVSMILILYLAR